jgi:predicted secreted protein
MARDELWQETSHALTQLAVHLGIMNATLQLPQYETVSAGWRERMREIRDYANRQTEEIHDFAERFD